eukprot:1074215-Pyramimonas_sp.AAC.1
MERPWAASQNLLQANTFTQWVKLGPFLNPEIVTAESAATSMLPVVHERAWILASSAARGAVCFNPGR